MTIERRNVGKRLSDLVINRASGTAYLAGQVADDPKADITGQTQQVLAQVDDLLFEAGTDKTKILSATIYLPDMADFGAMNAVWEQWVVPGQTPGPRHRRSEARRARVPDRNPGRRRGADPGLTTIPRFPPTMTSPAAAPPPSAADRKPEASAVATSPLHAATPARRRDGIAAGDARDLRPGDRAVLCAGPVPARPRRRLARLGPGRADVHRLRRRRGGHRARPLPSGDGQGADRAGGEALARVQLVHQRAGAAPRPAAHRRDLRRARVLLQLGRRGQRGGAQARAALRARPLRSRTRSASSRRSTPSTAGRCSRSPPAGRPSTPAASAPTRAASPTSATTTSAGSRRPSPRKAATTSAR